MPVTPDFISASVRAAARRQMQVGKKNLSRAQQAEFDACGSLTLTIKSALCKDGGVILGHLRARLFVFGVGITRARARATFDDDLVAAFDELIDGRRQQRDAMLL